MSILAPTDEIIEEISRRILKVSLPEKIILFGSRARGNQRADSDYDILIIEKSSLPRHKRAAQYHRALSGLGQEFDLVVWTPEELAEWLHVPNFFATTAVREGVVLFEKPV